MLRQLSVFSERLASCRALAFGGHRSPDGNKVTFSIDGIFIMEADGTNANQLSNIRWDYWPYFSPTGDKIAFQVHTESDPYDLYVMDVDGGNQTLLENTIAWELNAQMWSADGKRMVYSKPMNETVRSIFSVSVDDAASTQLTFDHGDFAPVWRPTALTP